MFVRTLTLRNYRNYSELHLDFDQNINVFLGQNAQGKTNIFFIRKKSEPLKPYYTIEVSNNFKIVQCYGYRNNIEQEKPDEIKAFVREYQNYLEELKNGQQRIKLKSA